MRREKRGWAAGGFASPVVLLFTLLLVSPLVLMATLSREEAMLTHKELLRRRAARLAEFAFREWSARADQALPGAPPRSGLFAARTPWSSNRLEVRDELGSYGSSASFRLLPTNPDGRPVPTVVLYNQACGFADSPFATEGYPILDLLLTGEVGIHRLDNRITLTWAPFTPPETAALVAGGPLHLVGPVLISGRPHPGDGGGDAADPAPLPGLLAVAAAGPVTTEGVVEIDPDPGTAPVAFPTADRLRDPSAVLGLPAAAAYLAKRAYRAPAPPPWNGVVNCQIDYRGEISGDGTLIVHNPLFDPLRDRASRDHDRGIDHPDYDPTYSHLDPSRRPAVLEPMGSCSFRGVIIADDFQPGTGTLDLYGQMFVLNNAPTTLGMSGGLTIRYSRDLIREYVHGGCDLVIEWLPGSGS